MTKQAKRILSLYMLFTVCFMAILVRIVYINFSTYASAGQKQATRTVVVGTSRGKIYDRNGELLVDETSKLVAAVTPVAAANKYVDIYFSQINILEKIEKGYPFVAVVKKEINNELIKTFSVPVRYSHSSLASHTVGYVDYSGRGVTGIEKAFEKELSEESGKLTVSFEVDALGRVLAGMDKTVTNENFNSKSGVVLTLDKSIQQLTENAIKESNIKSGCAVVIDASSGNIVALSSVPDFDRNNVEASLESENSPLVNKALESYSAGSVFKSVIAAFALENGISENESYECEGKITIGDKTFSCAGEKAHGKLNMAEALQQSCNIYFVNLTKKLDTEKLISFCEELGFGKSIVLCNGMESESGFLCEGDSLSLAGNLANFSFGQGELLVTPLQLAKVYTALSTGKVTEPRLVYGFCDSKGKVSKEKASKGKRVISENTVEKMREMLFLVTEKGIATNAKSDIVTIAGKTGTAQSGIFTGDGEEIYRTWFAGFYPYDEPRYVVVVMNENGNGGNYDCAPVVRIICEEIERASLCDAVVSSK